jgi:hypothetical protein
MPCLTKDMPQKRTELYGGRTGAIKDRPQQRSESYVGHRIPLYGSFEPFKTPRMRVAKYRMVVRNWESQWRCSREAYCAAGKGKQWVVVKVGDLFGANLQDRFKSLSERWREEIGPDSSLSNIVGNINYLRVIAMGEEAVPLILQELQREPAP